MSLTSLNTMANGQEGKRVNGSQAPQAYERWQALPDGLGLLRDYRLQAREVAPRAAAEEGRKPSYSYLHGSQHWSGAVSGAGGGDLCGDAGISAAGMQRAAAVSDGIPMTEEKFGQGSFSPVLFCAFVLR